MGGISFIVHVIFIRNFLTYPLFLLLYFLFLFFSIGEEFAVVVRELLYSAVLSGGRINGG